MDCLTEIMQRFDVHKYKSPKYVRGLKGQTWEDHDCGYHVKSRFEPAPGNDRIIGWLKNNSLFTLTNAWPEHFHSDYTYVFMGSNSVLCAVHVKTKNFSGGEVLNPRDHVYQHTVTIRSQPKGKELPKELTDILSELHFEESREDK